MSTLPAAARSSCATASPLSATCVPRTARPSSTCSDPKNPIVLAELTMAPGTHAHKVRVVGDTMVINQEVNYNDPNPPPPDFRGGIGIYDISNPRKPHLLNRWETGGQGVHRFDLDERYAYLSSTADGYLAHIVIILDLKDPRNPVEVARWWMPGQWTARRRDADLGEVGSPLPSSAAAGQPPLHQLLAGRVRHPGHRRHHQAEAAFPGSTGRRPSIVRRTRRCRLPFDIRGRSYMVVADEDVYRPADGVPAFLWMVDITDEQASDAGRQLPGRGNRGRRRSHCRPRAISRARSSPARKSRRRGSPADCA